LDLTGQLLHLCSPGKRERFARAIGRGQLRIDLVLTDHQSGRTGGNDATGAGAPLPFGSGIAT
jgi:hypothetical protein